jgi:transposase-like protein
MTQRTQRWSSEDRRRALELAAQQGPKRASEETGIPAGTIYAWRHKLARRAVAAAQVVHGRAADEPCRSVGSRSFECSA